jgi:polysaccharide export outer membrane protein
MAKFSALLTSLFLGAALTSGYAQPGAGVAEPPAMPRGTPGAGQNPYSIGAYPGVGSTPGGHSAPQNPSGYPAAGGPAPYGAMPAAPTSAPIPASGTDPDKPLGVGDQVTFQIMEDKDEPVSKRVLDTGELDIPYINRVQAAGKTCDQVAAEIKRRLEADYYYKATVRLGLELTNVGRPLGRIYLSGLVRMPGPQDLFPGERTTVSAVILKAGGFAQYANDRQVKVTRKTTKGETETFTVDVKAILKDGRLNLDREVREGDYIYVPQKLINF